MTALTWDQVGERIFETGIDRGVLYLKDGTAVSWNGLTGLDDDTSVELKPSYLEGVKYLDSVVPGDFSAKLRAITFPNEFNRVNGSRLVAPGLRYYEQIPKSFNLSYRTLKGNDLEGNDLGYKVHLLYNVMAVPDTRSYQTISDKPSPVEFAWTLSGVPPRIPGFRPPVHVSFDSTEAPPLALEAIEDALYGNEISDPHFPSLDEINDIFQYAGSLVIIDHGDGTWTAIDSGDDYVSMLDDTTFKIENSNATMLDANTYQISSTIV